MLPAEPVNGRVLYLENDLSFHTKLMVSSTACRPFLLYRGQSWVRNQEVVISDWKLMKRQSSKQISGGANRW